jgi:5-methylcytosine-specific restriction enzyme B
MRELLDLVYAPRNTWGDPVRAVFNGALKARYVRVADLTEKRNDEKRFQLRVNGDLNAVPYAGLLPPDQEQSGPYGGMSFVLFPADEDGAPALIAMGIGTNGLAPDEAILGRPGHGRKCNAIATWLNAKGQAGFAWAKRDPVRIDLDVPTSAARKLEPWAAALEKYGKVLYAVYAPPRKRSEKSDEVVLEALKAFVDLFFEERRIEQKKDGQADADRIRGSWLACAFPTASDDDVTALLKSRRFVIVEGPPGTGKTELARRILRDKYRGNGREIQFHPGTTYESFIGGLSPQDGGAMGFTFKPSPGHLLQAAATAKKNPDKRFLLVIDEINRADLAKVLGEAIYLFEPLQPDRKVNLQYDFPDAGAVFTLPKNLDVLGTMNSSDRSIAILDLAVRRRFAFVPLWPQLSVVEEHSERILVDAFQELLGIFFEHASDDALALLPGHSYFLGKDQEAVRLLATSVRPLLTEYLAQGYVAGFADEIRAYLDAMSQQH